MVCNRGRRVNATKTFLSCKVSVILIQIHCCISFPASFICHPLNKTILPLSLVNLVLIGVMHM